MQIERRKKMNELNELNEAQREAVEYNDGPLLIVAGAGSGKTRVLTYKIAYLLHEGVPANQILALTFTNKAAREMKERIVKLVGESRARYLWMGTFHSVCAKILRHEADKLGFTRDFSIYDTADSKSALKQIVKDLQLDDKLYKTNTLLGRISAAKNALIGPQEYALNADITKQDRYDRLYQMAEVYDLYTTRLREANAMDFDDLLVNTCRLLKEHPQALEYYRQIFQYVLVDEYQDTNYAQYVIVRLLAEPDRHICVVGDDAQSIYSFRGADIRNILNFRRDYPNARLFKLERNYRSTQNIVLAANSLIAHNRNRIPKDIYSENASGERLTLTSYMSDRDEAIGTAADIQRRSKGRSYDDFAVLYRTNAQSRAFENELRRLGVPYRIYGSTSFYQRKEIKDATAYFRLTANPRDNEALVRVINFPARGIGSTTMLHVAQCAAEKHLPFFDVVKDPAGAGLEAGAATQNKLRAFAAMIEQFAQDIDTLDAYTFAEKVLLRSGIMTAAAADRSAEGVDRKQNLEELLAGIHDFVDRRLQEGIDFTPIQDFLAEVSLLTDQDEHTDDHTPRVTLLTVHAAKGLEFKQVYIAGLEENLFPSQMCKSETEIEEERRLLYVAITRAMERCTISYARQRFRNGAVNFSSPSRFLNDIDRRFMLIEEAAAPAPSFGWRNSTWADERRSTPAYTPAAYEPEQPARMRPVAEAAKTVADSSFRSGDRVTHRVFGDGTVKRVYRENDNDKIDISFDKSGDKTLLLAYAKLTAI